MYIHICTHVMENAVGNNLYMWVWLGNIYQL